MIKIWKDRTAYIHFKYNNHQEGVVTDKIIEEYRTYWNIAIWILDTINLEKYEIETVRQVATVIRHVNRYNIVRNIEVK